jgi:hypothetical protein
VQRSEKRQQEKHGRYDSNPGYRHLAHVIAGLSCSVDADGYGGASTDHRDWLIAFQGCFQNRLWRRQALPVAGIVYQAQVVNRLRNYCVNGFQTVRFLGSLIDDRIGFGGRHDMVLDDKKFNSPRRAPGTKDGIFTMIRYANIKHSNQELQDKTASFRGTVGQIN